MDKQLLQYFSGKLTVDEQLEFLQQVEKDKSLKKDFIKLQNMFGVSQLLPKEGDEKEGEKHLEAFNLKLKKRGQKRIFKQIIRYASIAAVLFASTFFIRLYLNDRPLDQSMNTLYVPAGQRAQITLQDGTEVWLNAQSTLRYPARFSGNKRKVEVEGEAYFIVVANKKKPFIVSAKQLHIEVIGTEFNVDSYPNTDYVRTALVKGSLSIHKTDDKANSVILKPNEQLPLKDNRMSMANISNPDHLLWKNGVYSFNNERLIDILKKLECYYDITINVEDQEMFASKYTGKFRQSDGVDEILTVLQKIQPFKITRERESNIITLSK